MMKKLTALFIMTVLLTVCAAAAADGLTSVVLSDDGMAFAQDTGIIAEGSIVTITRPGDYLISGSLSDGRIVVDCREEGKVTLQLNSVEIRSKDGPAIHIVKCSPRTTISLVEATVNRLENGTKIILNEDEEPNGVIFSKDDLTIGGQGTLTVTAGAMDGIVSKDDLRIKDGNITVTAPRHGIRGKDSVEISGGTLIITAGKDGIRTTNKKRSDAGWISVTGGKVTIRCCDDALSYVTACDIKDAAISVIRIAAAD